MSWYRLMAGSANKTHHFNHVDDFIFQNTESAFCGSIGFGQDLEKSSNPSPDDMCSRCSMRLAKSYKNFEGKY